MSGIKSLLKSRKVLIAAVGVLQTLVLHYLKIDPEVWASIDGLLLALIVSIAHEDAAEKQGSNAAMIVAETAETKE